MNKFITYNQVFNIDLILDNSIFYLTVGNIEGIGKRRAERGIREVPLLFSFFFGEELSYSLELQFNNDINNKSVSYIKMNPWD